MRLRDLFSPTAADIAGSQQDHEGQQIGAVWKQTRRHKQVTQKTVLKEERGGQQKKHKGRPSVDEA